MIKKLFLGVWVLGALACNSLASFTKPAATLTFAPDATVDISNEVLEETRVVIQSRFDNALSDTATARVENHQIIVEVSQADDIALATQLATEDGALVFFDSTQFWSEGDTVPKDVVPILTEADIDEATVISTTNGVAVGVKFTDEGKLKMATHSLASIGHYLVIARDGLVISSPLLNAPILEGEAVIQGRFTIETANNLVVQLNSGRLVLALNLVETK